MNAVSIYKSSAGSGKTYTLVREYLKLVLPYPTKFRHVLAVTFTNKATDEMKSRILKALIELAEAKNKNLEQELAKEFSLSKLNIQEQAQKCLNFILHHYSDFAVTTIDSFFNSIVKSLALEMQLPLRFEIELDQDYISDDITERLLQQIGKDKKLTDWLQAFAYDKIEENKGWKIKDELKKISKQLFREEFYKEESKTETDYSAITTQLKVVKKNFELQIKKFGDEFLSLITKHGFTIEDFAYGKNGIAGYFSKITRTNLKSDVYVYGKRVSEAHENIDAWLSKAKQNSPVKDLIASNLHPLLNGFMKFYQSNFIHYCSANEALKLIYVAGIIHQLKSHLRDYRDEHSLITIADANMLIKKFVSANDTPFVYEKTGNKFHHFLLDEFQDTSDVQWKNLLPLINNALASGNSALIVGDVKQAIYRWRGGNMNLLQNEIKNDLQMYASLISEKNLNINYRSTKEVIEFNNSFFGLLPKVIGELEHADYDLIVAAYKAEEVMQLFPEKNKQNGYVNISFIDEKEIPQEEDEKVKWKDESLDRLIPTIDKLLSDGYSFGDMAILVRSKYEGNAIARHLYNNGIDKLISADSLLIHKAPNVQFVVNAIRFLYNRKNILLRKEMAYFLSKDKVNEADLENVFDDKENELFKSLMPPSYFTLSNYYLQLPVYDLAEQLIKLFELNKTPDAYLQRLLDVILEYIAKNPQDSLSFINWWDEHAERKGFSVVTPEQGDAITIITIHKSKGLQYPVVLMPMCDWKLKPKPGELMWVTSDENPYNEIENIPVPFSGALENTFFSEHHKKEIQLTYIDNLNLLYVAFTRAAERLYITTPINKSDKINNISQLLRLTIERNVEWQNHFNESENALILGVEIKKEKCEDKIAAVDFFHPLASTITSFPINDWKNKVGVKTHKEYFSSQIEFGNILHKTLSFIITESDLEFALNKAKNIFILNDETLLEVETSIKKIFAACKQHEWFTGKYAVRNEAELFSIKEIIRPDRLLFNEHETIIVDYKTGAEEKSYLKQIADYKSAMQLAGHKSVKGYLLYTLDCKLFEVEE